jgi:uncharacterized protein (TIGR00661 family)
LKILITPLDWGLGHATRCIPIINALVQQGNSISIASSGSALVLLKKEFPTFQFFELPSYNPVYASNGWLVMKLLGQVAKFFRAIKKEHEQIQQIVKEHFFDVIISDHRYGCYSQQTKNIFITHQVNFLFTGFWKLGAALVNHWHHQKMEQFDLVWVPDLPDQKFSANLSKSDNKRIQYIGILSRFLKLNEEVKKKYDLLILISGPEPQRTIFEELVKHQLANTALQILIVKGKLTEGEEIRLNQSIGEVGHLPTHQLQQVIEQSDFVLCRSGYSTVMDLATLGKKNIIFVPTPGQPEQEYLATKFKSEGIAYSVEQNDLLIERDMKWANDFKGFDCSITNDLLMDAIENLTTHRKHR